MAYLHIDNLYKSQAILLFKECYAMEKIHGTSAHVSWSGVGNGAKVGFFSGGVSHEQFVALFDEAHLQEKFTELLGEQKCAVFGEAYGGKCQGMSKTYGTSLKFVAFEVKIGDSWLCVPAAEKVVLDLGLEFVHYVKIPTTLGAIDEQRDAPSEQARRNGMGEHMREGVVLRPLEEMHMNNGSRVISKHKRDEFKETATPRKVDVDKQAVLKEAQTVADEWVTPRRLEHVLDKLPDAKDITHTGKVIGAMLEDVLREGEGEFEATSDVKTAVGKRTAKLFHIHLRGAV
jgi:hypothetical protein